MLDLFEVVHCSFKLKKCFCEVSQEKQRNVLFSQELHLSMCGTTTSILL